MTAAKALTISIIIPSYNEENHLPACLDAIAAQTTAPDEVIVIDNNSTDRTAQIAANYPFVKILSEKRRGVAYARDTGFNAASSILIGRIDADTVLPIDWIEKVKEFYATPANSSRGLSGGAYFYNAKAGNFWGWWQGQIAFRANKLLLGHYLLYGSNTVIPAAGWQKVKKLVCHDVDMHEDLDLAIHWHRAGLPITYQESLRVGVKMRRVFEDRDELWENMLWWPRTLRRHGLWTWVFGWLGAVLLYVTSLMHRAFRK